MGVVVLMFHSNNLKESAQCPSEAAGYLGQAGLLEAGKHSGVNAFLLSGARGTLW